MKILTFLKKPKVFIPLLLLMGAIVFVAVRGGSALNGGIETQIVERATVAQVVQETGVVEPARAVDIGFGVSGKVASVPTQVGDNVEAGQVLASIDSSSENAMLLSARARLDSEIARLDELRSGVRDVDARVVEVNIEAAEASLESAEEALENAEETQDRLVANARRQLLSGGLAAYLAEGGREEDDDSYVPPTITGTYTGDETGEYRIELYRSNTQTGYSFRYSGIEEGVGSVSTIQPEPLGDSGLYITFPENFARGQNLEWVIPIPNPRSVTYSQLESSYNSALVTRESTLDQMRAQVESAQQALELARAQGAQTTAPATQANLRAQEAAVAQARASVEQSELALANTSLIAPFGGLVTSMNIEEGEFASPGVPVASLITSADYEITVGIPEVDIELVEVGDEAEVTFDAYRGVSFPAHVVAVAPQAQATEGVTVIEVTVQMEEGDERIRAGLSADVEIMTESREGVLSVPSRALIERDGETYVRVITEEGEGLEAMELVPVEEGLRGSSGMVEVTGGLSEGDEVVTFLPEAVRRELEVSE